MTCVQRVHRLSRLNDLIMGLFVRAYKYVPLDNYNQAHTVGRVFEFSSETIYTRQVPRLNYLMVDTVKHNVHGRSYLNHIPVIDRLVYRYAGTTCSNIRCCEHLEDHINSTN